MSFECAELPRRTRLYCIGTPKSGTHSIAALFENSLRAYHEPDNLEVINKVLDLAEGRITPDEMHRYIRIRDRRRTIEVDSSHLNIFLLEALIEEFPDARFILTIRDCYTWLDSLINHSLKVPHIGKEWIRLRDLRFRPKVFSHAPEERVLKEHGLYTLDGYLSYWSTHNEKVIAALPDDRLLVVRTDAISASTNAIATFAGLPKEVVSPEKSHAFRNPAKYHILRQIDADFIDQQVRFYCNPLMERFFPEIRCMRDAKL